MAKLHEGLAIHKDRSAVMKKITDEARGVFKNAAHFQGFNKLTEYYAEEDSKFNQVEEKKIDETVPSKLDYVNEHVRNFLDLDFQIVKSNSGSTADLVMDGNVVARAVPVAFLLTLEEKFKEYRTMIEMIPTQAPGIKWIEDTQQSSKHDIFKTERPVTTFLTKKKPVYQVVVQATPEHPAQVKDSHDDVRVAKVETTHYTAAITPAQKSDMLARVDDIIRAAKRARQRANDVELNEERIAEPLLNYIVHGTSPWAPRS